MSVPLDGVPVVYVCALHVILHLDPSLHVDVAHFLAGEERVVLQNHIVSVPNDAAQLVAAERYSCTDSNLLWCSMLPVFYRALRGKA